MSQRQQQEVPAYAKYGTGGGQPVAAAAEHTPLTHGLQGKQQQLREQAPLTVPRTDTQPYVQDLPSKKLLSDALQVAIHNAVHCHKELIALIPHCLAHGGAHAELSYMKKVVDAMEACLFAAHCGLRQSDATNEVFGMTACFCNKAAQALDSEQFKSDQTMQAVKQLLHKAIDSFEAIQGAGSSDTINVATRKPVATGYEEKQQEPAGKVEKRSGSGIVGKMKEMVSSAKEVLPRSLNPEEGK